MSIKEKKMRQPEDQSLMTDVYKSKENATTGR
jgi:hypothetical protein